MGSFSPACLAILDDNLDDLPDSCFHHDVLTETTEQEALWACCLELIASLFKGRLPPTVRVGREQCALKVTKEQWKAFQRELGLTEPDEMLPHVLAVQLLSSSLPRSSQLTVEPPLVERVSPLLFGVVLVTLHLNHVYCEGRPPQLPFDSRLLEDAAERHPIPESLGPFHSRRVAKELSDWSGLRFRDPWALRSAYYGYYMRLSRRLEGCEWSLPQSDGEELSDDFLLQGMKRSSEPTPPPTVDPAIVSELSHLRERAQKKGSSLADALLQILTPSLECKGPPIDLLQADDPELVGETLRSLISLLDSAEVEVFGQPGALLQLSWPNADYELDPSATLSMSGEQSFVVVRRGLRVNGELIAKARVLPKATRRRR